ncbi:telomere repeat-binding factor 1-like isoform X2 [Trifolium pratense]|uniref:telomere repeat-binding factor 1-like isoform X2 n=1 Tax=Trifolium pratense TaxID=57577 RepID=UPI001E6946E2|nr:telomere repeat-binding factor 1-like isoform X2 [Trifolium pratense]
MGAPKQKWSAEEEAALKAGVVKHGDKWRNLSVMANGWTSREKAKVSIRRAHHQGSRHDDNPMAVTPVTPSDDEIVDVKPLQVSRDMQIPGPRGPIVRLDNLIMDAISCLNEHGGSNKTTIAAFIEDQYYAPEDFKKMLSAKLKYLTSRGKLIKVKRRYRIAPTPAYSDRGRRSPMSLLEGRQRGSFRFDMSRINMPTQSEIDIELEKIRSMSAEEAAAVAARAVAAAEAALAEAEEAVLEAEAAEAEADAAEAFAEAARKTEKETKSLKMVHPA